MKIVFLENPSENHAEFISRQFYEYFSAGYGFDYQLYDILFEGCISLFKRYNISECGLWVLEDGSYIKGSIIVDGGQRDTLNRAQLRLFCLSEDVRGQGWGNKLLRQSIEFTKEQGFSGLFLWTLNGVEPVGHMYRKAGFISEEIKLGTQWGKEVPEEKFILDFPEK